MAFVVSAQSIKDNVYVLSRSDRPVTSALQNFKISLRNHMLKRIALISLVLLVPSITNAKTVNDYMQEHHELQNKSDVYAKILDWVNDPVNKDGKESGYELAEMMVNELAQACLAGYPSISDESCKAVVFTAGNK